VKGRKFGRLPSHRGSQGHYREVREACRGVGVLNSACAVIACPGHSGCDFRQQERGDDDGIAVFLNCRENRQTLGVAIFMRIERVHEHAGVNGIPRMYRGFLA
jgi:hypothetical protein